MPKVVLASSKVTEIGDGMLAIDVVLRNEHAIPTRTALAAGAGVGRPDLVTLEGVEVLAGGCATDRFRPERIDLAECEPARLMLEDGIGGHADVRLRWLVRAPAGDGVATLRWSGEKAQDLEAPIPLK